MTTEDAEMKAEMLAHPARADIARAMALAASSANAEAELERGLSARGVRYVVGGWTTGARHALAMQAAEYSVTLVFAHRGSCEYVSDVNVRVADERGEEVARLSETGPIVLLDLPQGTYQITVTRDDHALARAITVGPRTRRQTVFYWSGVNENR